MSASSSEDRSPLSIRSLLKSAGLEWVEDNCMRLAASVSFYTFLSFAPLLVILFKCVAVLYGSAVSEQKLRDQVGAFIGPQFVDGVMGMLHNADKPGSGAVATVISIAVLLFSATGVFNELQDSMNTIWEVQPRPNQGIWGIVRNRLLALAMVMGMLSVLIGSVAVSTFVTGFARDVEGPLHALTYVVEIGMSLIVMTLLFAAVFKILPDVLIPWRLTWLGAFVSAVLFVAGKYGIAFYFRFASTTSVYGAAGSLAAVLLWVYYSTQLLFFGAEFTQVYAQASGTPLLPAKNAEHLAGVRRTKARRPRRKKATPTDEVAAYLSTLMPLATPSGNVTADAADVQPLEAGEDIQSAPVLVETAPTDVVEPEAQPLPETVIVVAPTVSQPAASPPSSVAPKQEALTSAALKTILAAGAGLAAGALLGVSRSVKGSSAPFDPSRRQLEAVRLEARLKALEMRLHGDTKTGLAAKQILRSERINAIDNRLRAINGRLYGGQTPPKWIRQIANALKR